ncbi:MAG: class I SAM-dependent methyltransferase [Anaerolineaceae bacterium]|nr:class I SAM-dependent methyltransferase [Anaerolineaceae bacterium]
MSIKKQKIHGITFPGFPPPNVQTRFVGSSYKQTLEEAFGYYKHVKEQVADCGIFLNQQTKFLDFGCGWGRFMRFFMKDITVENLYGCDPLQVAIDICHDTGVPGHLDLIEPEGILPYPDSYFDVIMAYSVFTHLPEKLNLHWMRELARVSRPGCVFCLTLEPRGFIDRICNITEDTDNAWLRGLSKYAPMAKELYSKFDSGEIAYLPTGGGDNLTDEVYGDAIVPLDYIKKKWRSFFKVISYLDYPEKYWLQARLVVQRS